MRSHAGAPPSRRRFLALAAGGAAAGTAALGGCALPVSTGVGGSGETVTLMVKPDDISPELIKQAHDDFGVRIVTVHYDITKLIAMMTSGSPPDLVRGVGAVDAPYFAARDVMEDLDPVNDLWRYDGRTQGERPRYGMAKDFSQDSMYWYNTALFDEAGVDYPPETEPVTYDLSDLRQARHGRHVLAVGAVGGWPRRPIWSSSSGSSSPDCPANWRRPRSSTAAAGPESSGGSSCRSPGPRCPRAS